MKLTEEHKQEIEALSGGPALYAAGIELGATWAIEKYGGIQWNDAFLITPPAKEELLVLAPDGTLHLCSWRNAYNVFEVQGKKESPEGWQWAEINLPNQ